VKTLAIAAWILLAGIALGAWAKHQRHEKAPTPEDFRRGRQDRVEHWACMGTNRCRLCECAEEAPDGCVRRVCAETCVPCEEVRR